MCFATSSGFTGWLKRRARIAGELTFPLLRSQRTSIRRSVGVVNENVCGDSSLWPRMEVASAPIVTVYFEA
jgi:hypothetical protein